MAKLTEKTLAELIKEKLGPAKGQELIDKLDGIQSADDLGNVLKEFKSAKRISPLILIVWAAEV